MMDDKKRTSYKNAEGYSDPTAGAAYSNILEAERREETDRLSAINELIPILKKTAELVGFRIVGRVVLEDITTGKRYR